MCIWRGESVSLGEASICGRIGRGQMRSQRHGAGATRAHSAIRWRAAASHQRIAERHLVQTQISALLGPGSGRKPDKSHVMMCGVRRNTRRGTESSLLYCTRTAAVSHSVAVTHRQHIVAGHVSSEEGDLAIFAPVVSRSSRDGNGNWVGTAVDVNNSHDFRPH